MLRRVGTQVRWQSLWRSRLPLGILLGALGFLGLAGGQAKAQDAPKGQAASVPSVPSTPVLQALSAEIDSLKRSVQYQVGMRFYSKNHGGFENGIHLGKGLIAAPFSEGLKLGDCGFAYMKKGKFRFIHIGSDKPFVSFFRFLDPLALDRLPIPKLPKPSARRENPGNLVVLVGPTGEAKLRFLPHIPGARGSRRFRRPEGQRRKPGRDRRMRSPFSFFGFILPGESVVSGSVALSPKGEFLGMAVQGPKPSMGSGPRPRVPTGNPSSSPAKEGTSRRTPPREQGQKPKGRLHPSRSFRRIRTSPSWGRLSFVLSHRLLMVRAERWSKKTKDLLPNRILLGISLDWRRARKNEAQGVVVTDLFPGAPASRAGIKVGDRLLRFGSKTIQSRTDLMKALAEHKVGETVPVALRRGDQEVLTKIHLN